MNPLYGKALGHILLALGHIKYGNQDEDDSVSDSSPRYGDGGSRARKPKKSSCCVAKRRAKVPVVRGAKPGGGDSGGSNIL